MSGGIKHVFPTIQSTKIIVNQATFGETPGGIDVPLGSEFTWKIDGVEKMKLDSSGCTIIDSLSTGFVVDRLKNGLVVEHTDITITSDGVDTVLNFSKEGGGNFNIQIEEVKFTVTAGFINLIEGSDTSPTFNFIYIVIAGSTPIVTVSTTDWPMEPHARLATSLVPSSTFVQANGPYSIHKWADHHSLDETGEIAVLNQHVRSQPPIYQNGCDQTFTPLVGVTDTTLIFSIASGSALQLHRHTIPALTAKYYVPKDPDTPFREITDLVSLLKDSTGTVLTNRFYNIVLATTIGDVSSDSKLFVVLPTGSYADEISAKNDVSNFTNFDASVDIVSSVILLSRWTIQNINDSSWKHIENQDLRGKMSNSAAGTAGQAGLQTEFTDNAFRVTNTADNAKKIAFNAANITTSTVRTIAMIDEDVTIVGLTNSQTLTNKTLTTPIITSISNSGTVTIPSGVDTLVARTSTDTLTNKTLTNTNNNVVSRALHSATTVVNINSATAPSSGQVLTATSSTAATWQTPGLATFNATGADQSVSGSFGFTQVVRLTFTSVASNYIIQWYCEVNVDTNNRSLSVQVQRDDTETLASVIFPTANVTGDRSPVSGLVILTLTAESHNFDLDFAASGTGTYNIRRARIFAMEI